MKPEIVTYLSRDEETTIYAEKYVPVKDIKAILILAHGMNEYFGRYKELCEVLANEGYLVAGPDHLGHGHTARDYQMEAGFFTENDPATVVVRDLHRLKKMIQEEYPGVDIFLLGHSMGSFIARNYIEMYGSGIKGAIIMGTGRFSDLKLKAGLCYIRLSEKIHGSHFRDRICTIVSLGPYAKLFPEDGPLGWVCARKEARDESAKDPLMGQEFTLNGYGCLSELILRMQDKKRMKAIPRNLPILLMSGEDDPVGGKGEGIKKIAGEYKDLGFTDVSFKLYPGDRHEIYHEEDRFRVFFDIMDFMEKHGSKGKV